MSRIYVTGVPGRVARISPKGVYVPYDRPVAAQLTPYMQRRIDDGDVKVIARPVKTAYAEPKAAPAPAEKKSSKE